MERLIIISSGSRDMTYDSQFLLMQLLSYTYTIVKMPECQAKFCTVVRGQGISTFSIPDPKKEYERCARWLHNLGNAKLDIKTFKHSFNMIVCEKHFEPSCFKEDMQAKVMGYTPKKKFLKDDAIPTIFADTKPILERKSSKSRKEKMEKQELIETLLTGNENPEVEMQQLSTPSVERKRKQKMPSISSKKLKVTSTFSSKTDFGIQVGPTYVDKSVSCNIITEIPTTHCTKCFERDNPSLAVSDHSYFSGELQHIIDSSTPIKKKDQIDQNNPAESDVDDFLSPVKTDVNDKSFCLSDFSEDSPLSSPEKNVDSEKMEASSISEDTKLIVFLKCLTSLFQLVMCRICQSPIDTDDIRTTVEGSCITARFTCLNNHSFSWESQPYIGRQPVGNILMTAATYLSGNTYSSISAFFQTLNSKFISRSAFYDIANSFVIPCIHKFWCQQQEIILRNMLGRKLCLVGDGRCDSPGFSAKYCNYTLMEASTSAILDFNIVQVTETGASSRMELEGFKRTLSNLQESNLEIDIIATDRHVQIRKYIKDNLPTVSHQFDVWHMSNSIRKKIVKASKKKGCESLVPWIRSIANHIWFCAGNCDGDPDKLIEMWKSILFHIRNIHTFAGKKFKRCGHGDLSAECQRKKKWLTAKSKPFKALESVINDTRVLKDLRQLNLFCHTGDIEVFHSMMLKYVPKRQEFQYPQMVARSQLAALDHNFNLRRKQKETSDGSLQFAPVFPKATSRWCVKKRYADKDYGFRDELMELIVKAKIMGEKTVTPHQIKQANILPKNIATKPAPPKETLVEAHVSRFKIN